MLASDGLFERPGRTPAESSLEVLRVLAEACHGHVPAPDRPRMVEAVTLAALDELLRETGHADDVALLAAQLTAAPAPLQVRVEATQHGSRRARRALAAWLETLAVAVVDRITVQHATGELMDNVVAHAYGPDRGGDLCLDADLGAGGVLTCRVEDGGRWRERPHVGDDERSPLRGLAMAKALVDHLELQPGRDRPGTVALLTQRLTRPARLLTTPGPSPRRPGAEDLEVELVGERVHVRGEVDAGGAGTLRGLLVGATGGGSLPAVVDLAGVTHLGSAAVQVLHDLAGAGSGVRLWAPYGSVAQHVLTLAGLPVDG